ncbi:MAG: hypothetical protein KKB30_08895 [Proteobacteria bacterium]|nr:hypothetical protein [Pseudomonadota bacterium]MBU1716860.1 hypothetical protein [Pseudomonadota bacterium]
MKKNSVSLTTDSSRIIRDNDNLRDAYHSLNPGDLILGRIRLKSTEEHILLDLSERGVILFPSALSQLSCRSKTSQALLFAPQMLPHTRAIHDIHDMLAAMNHYQQAKISQVITKRDRSNAGMGINLWNSTEEVFNQASLGSMPFPFVMQPFHPNCRDIRIIVLGSYVEAYWRCNPDNFRNNLHFGGNSSPCQLTKEQWDLCQKVMARGKFPYAHIDLIVTEDGSSFLAEINLRGGIRGAKIKPDEYRQRLNDLHRKAEKDLSS